MEDAVDALKMAVSVFLFIIALGIVFAMFSQAKEASDIVLTMTDRTYLAQYEFPDGNTNGGRTVGIETIIPTLYRYYDENLSVDIANQGRVEEKFDKQVENNVYHDRASNSEEDLYNPDGVIWFGTNADYQNMDIQKRVSAYIDGTNTSAKKDKYEINGIGLRRYESSRSLNRNSTYIETFSLENDDKKSVSPNDGSIYYVTRGTTKLYITYTY